MTDETKDLSVDELAAALDAELKVETPEVEQPAEEASESEAPKYSEAELKAIEKGWKPKDQFEGDADEWEPAKKFLKRSELFDHIYELKDTVKNTVKEKEELKKQVAALVKVNQRIEVESYKKAIEDLKQIRKQAVEIGDSESVERVSEQIDELKSKEASTAKAPVNEHAPEVHEFLNKHQDSWLNDKTDENKEMSAFAVAHEDTLARLYPNLSLAERFAKVEDKLKKVYPHRFEEASPPPTPKVAPTPPPIAGTGSEGRKAEPKTRFVDLPKDLQDAYNAFKSIMPSYTLEEAVSDWKKNGVIK